MVSLLIIVGAVSISGCLGPNEEQKYNEQMTLVYNSMSEFNADTKNISSIHFSNNADFDYLISTYTKMGNVCDNNTKILTDLNNSISNNTRKEYIGLCIDELKIGSNESKLIIEMAETIKKYNDKKMTAEEVYTKVSDIKSKLGKMGTELNETNKKAKEYEKKYPFVLINGTKSLNDVMNENK